MSIAYQVGVAPDVAALCNLRASVGWDRAESDYPAAFTRYATCVAAYVPERHLISWCAAVSDGVRHGFLMDVIVHPEWRRRGVGTALIEKAIASLQHQSISIVHVDFVPEHRGFYERLGFRSSEAGILEAPHEHPIV